MDMDNIEGFLLDHAVLSEGRWHRCPEGSRGPYFVSARCAPQNSRFLELIRRKVKDSPGCNPLDGREHSIVEIARWMAGEYFALQFVGMGVMLGIFELSGPWEAQAGEDSRQMCRRLERSGAGRFRAKGIRSREVIAVVGERMPPSRYSRVRGPRRRRYLRGTRARTCGITRPEAR